MGTNVLRLLQHYLYGETHVGSVKLSLCGDEMSSELSAKKENLSLSTHIGDSHDPHPLDQRQYRPRLGTRNLKHNLKLMQQMAGHWLWGGKLGRPLRLCG